MSYGPVGTTDRLCDWPSCPAIYDALAVMDGKASAPGWLQHPTFSLHMCGRHAPLTFGAPYRGGPHYPVLNRDTLDGSCSCGHALTTGQSTLGQISAAYRAHLAEIAPSATESPCSHCCGSRFEPGTEAEGDWDSAAMRHHPYTGEPCSACNGAGKRPESPQDGRTAPTRHQETP